MSYDPDDKTDWKNYLKKCNHCGEIWLKVSGCDGNTKCGAIETGPDKFDGKANFRFWTPYTHESQLK